MAENVRQFKIFLSSPGDVYEERDTVRELIKEVLPYSPFIRGRATFDIVSWDDPHAAPGLDAHLTPQDAINRKLPKPSECDIVIVILWGRMGTPLPPEITKGDGAPYQSGTEWEFEDAVNAAQTKGSPTTLLYQRAEKPKIDLDDPKLHEKAEDYQKVKGFFERFQDADGSLKGSFATYETIDAFREVLRQQLDSVVSGLLGQEYSEELGVTKAAVETMLAILREQQVPPDQLKAKLKEIAERHLELTERLHALSKSNDEPEITGRRQQAAEAIERGDYDRAAELLADAVAIDRSAIDEQQEELDRRRLSAAATMVQQGKLEHARLDYRKAATYFAEAVKLVPASEKDTQLDYLGLQAAALTNLGRDPGDSAALLQAIEIYQIVLSKQSRRRVPLEWARTHFRLGNALRNLGERENGTERLEQAIQAYEKALLEWTRQRVPQDWAKIRNNLGLTLQTLGNRETGVERLEQAVKVYQSALEERPRKSQPHAWAGTLMNIGTALTALGSRQKNPVRLIEAIDAISGALEERTRERVPFDWAFAQMFLGNALSSLGELDGGTDRLEQAVSAYKAALLELSRERLPTRWAWTHQGLGWTYCLIAKETRNETKLLQGIDSLEIAIKVYKERQATYFIETATNKLADANALLSDFKDGLISR